MKKIEPIYTPLLLGVAETASQFGVSKSLIRKLISQGELPSCLVARRRMVPVAAAVSWVHAHTITARRTATKQVRR